MLSQKILVIVLKERSLQELSNGILFVYFVTRTSELGLVSVQTNQCHYSGTSLIRDQSLFRLVQISETIHSNEGAISVLFIA